ncbi:type III-B CRISPR module RAMP protein Cmr4 [Vibrio gazogenes]|uniref:CRISPR-associated protein Cmr4 n=1 Tax=Vibrio gazogenes DSM 21264 = NBRC 103151 TaxID=1123492 RepID=A0A1M4VBY6_VIBGA|nr:type III-B CRISPR module RAMP protein Cmr4 [Vibrio gazogenes]USP15577.1 type III-B CRISPR module RAMP protein Cmr4 [Vibrio gazogenes]SHE66451.1 CRISPR-associated protein Cmr4 [Vibrio gazogenes DSM 21264] [Vibrio gazogenes DSM 21264 = NBRC 103151]SJN57108.1 RAMP superfamily protein [Vibrio gazogenes]
MKTTSNLLFMQAETQIHAGAGNGNGLIDLPIMREAHNNWPVIFGSAVKGAYRVKATNDNELNKHAKGWFGQSSEDAEGGVGDLLFGDARLLWLPVRSLNSHTLWVTCPAVLQRYVRDVLRIGGKINNFGHSEDFANPRNKAYRCSSQTPSQQEDLLIEDFCLSVETRKTDEKNEVQDWFDTFLKWLETTGVSFSGYGDEHAGKLFQREIKQKLILVDDNLFRHLCTTATPVTPHVKLVPKTKANDSLWYVETLPPETMFYSTVICRSSDTNEQLKRLCENYVQVGGHETTGMGWMNTCLLSSEQLNGEKK